VSVETAISDPCIPWWGYVNPDGYGIIHRRRQGPGKYVQAHRAVYEECFGPLALNEHLHHRCGRRDCVNPNHLQVHAPADHPRLHAAGRTHCRRGHAYAEHGRVHAGKKARFCRACERENERRRASRSTS
jgi:hypothetical protein